MTSTVQKWGNSLALRLPKSMTQALELSEGDSVELKTLGDTIQIKPSRRKYRLSDLVAQMDKSALHSETDWGSPFGREVW